MVHIEEIPSDEEQESKSRSEECKSAKSLTSQDRHRAPTSVAAQTMQNANHVSEALTSPPATAACSASVTEVASTTFTRELPPGAVPRGNLYSILHASPSDTTPEIDERYRSAIRSYTTEELIVAVRQRQENKPAENERQANLMEIMYAYNVLSDSALRADYNLQLQNGNSEGMQRKTPNEGTCLATTSLAATKPSTTSSGGRTRIINETKRQETAELRVKEQQYQQQRDSSTAAFPSSADTSAGPSSKGRHWETQRERAQKMLNSNVGEDLLAVLDEERFGKRK